MTAPFGSRTSTAGLACLLAALLALPLALPPWMDRRYAYRAMPLNAGNFGPIEREVFDEPSDIDMLFLGGSHIWAGVHTPALRDALGRALGRPANVITLGTNYAGADHTFLLLRDVLAHRRVHTVVLLMPPAGHEWTAHPHAHQFLLPGEPSVGGLPLRYRAQVYATQVLGAPRHLLSLLRPDPEPRRAPGYYAQRAGALLEERTMDGTPFVPRDLSPPVVPVEMLVYDSARPGPFRFDGEPLNPYQHHFTQQIGLLLQQYGLRGVALHVPVRHEAGSDVVRERRYWPDVAGAGLQVVGIVPSVLFRGLTASEIDHLYYNENHLNSNGALLFTRAITPALVRIHVQG